MIEEIAHSDRVRHHEHQKNDNSGSERSKNIDDSVKKSCSFTQKLHAIIPSMYLAVVAIATNSNGYY